MAIRSLVLQTLVLTYSMTAGAFQSNPPSVTSEPEGLARLGIAVAAGMLGLLVRDRVARQNERSANFLAVDLIVIYGLAILSQVLLAFLSPELVLPRWAPTQGGFVGFVLFAATRALFSAQPAAVGGPLSEMDGGMSRELVDEGNLYGRVYGIAVSLALTVGLLGLFTNSLRIQIAAVLIVTGSVRLLWRMFSGQAKTATTASEQRLTTCIETLRGATAWYYLALFPASIIALFGSRVYLYWVPLVILMFAEANQRAAASVKSGWETVAAQRRKGSATE
ncbi:MAG: hypothetical protein H7039_24625 [Bryobacteraceae bacterium]|nr:hypothetical protein [Bryobacteraceae bacterium]